MGIWGFFKDFLGLAPDFLKFSGVVGKEAPLNMFPNFSRVQKCPLCARKMLFGDEAWLRREGALSHFWNANSAGIIVRHHGVFHGPLRREEAVLCGVLHRRNDGLQAAVCRKTVHGRRGAGVLPARFHLNVLRHQILSSDKLPPVDKQWNTTSSSCVIDSSSFVSFFLYRTTMASVDLRDELLCSICLSSYTDPVLLRCGHNYCRLCIGRVLDTQAGSGDYSCADCREEFQERPALMRNLALRNIMENLLITQPAQTETGIFCTYCVDSPVPAVKSCLHCEASLCDKHLRVHSKSAEHVLSEPSTSLENRKCSVHKKIREYYCTEDAACICVYCSAGGHRGHRVEMLDEASENKKMKLRNVLQKLTTKRKKTEERVQGLEERRRKALKKKKKKKKAAGEAERVTALCTDIRRWVDDLEKKVLREISRQEKEESLPLSALIQKLEIKKDELSKKMRHIEELCNRTDPLTVLQEPDTGDLCDPEEEGSDEDTGEHGGGDEDTGGHGGGDEEDRGEHDGGEEDTGGHDGGDEDTGGHDVGGHGVDDLDVAVISDTLHTLCDIITGIRRGISVEDPADILLDVNTPGNNLRISDDLKTATGTQEKQNRPETVERFLYNQVMSRRRFTSGHYYWDVETNNLGYWRVGMCYPSIDRRGRQSYIGNNNKSWAIWRYNNKYAVIHDSKEIRLPDKISSDRFRVCLDYEAGRLSFYELCDPIRHLHTCTEPLHTVLLLNDCYLTL
ncbi:RING, partial [Pristimantis euphronides]